MLICLFVCLPAFGQAPMKSIGFGSDRFTQCTGADQLMPLDSYGADMAPPAIPNAGPNPGPAKFPTGVFHIRSVCVMHKIIGRGEESGMSYVYAGHWSVNGDQLTPIFSGTGYACKDYPADAPHIFTPGEYLDVHAQCSPPGTHYVTLQVWYTDH